MVKQQARDGEPENEKKKRQNNNNHHHQTKTTPHTALVSSLSISENISLCFYLLFEKSNEENNLFSNAFITS